MSVGRYHAWIRLHLSELVDVLPHEDEVWTLSETDLSRSAFDSLRVNSLIVVEEPGEPDTWRTMPSTADQVREYVERYGVKYEGEDPLATASETDVDTP